MGLFAQVLAAGFGNFLNGGLLLLGGGGVACVVDQRQLHALDIIAVVGDVTLVLALGDGGGAVFAVGQLQNFLGFLGVEQVIFNGGTADTVCLVQLAVGLPQAVGIGGDAIQRVGIQLAAKLGKGFFYGGVIFHRAVGQLLDVLGTGGGDFLIPDGAGAFGFQHGADIAGFFALRQGCLGGGGVVGVVLHQQVQTGRDLDPAYIAHGGRGAHIAARQGKQHTARQNQAEAFGFDRTHKIGSPFTVSCAARAATVFYYTSFCRTLQAPAQCGILEADDKFREVLYAFDPTAGCPARRRLAAFF